MRRQLFSLRSSKSTKSADLGHTDLLPDPDQAWKALSLVNEWIRHAEAKATATLAGAGVSGGVLYNLVHSQSHPSVYLDVVATINALAVIASGGSAVLALIPRLKVRKAKPVQASATSLPQTTRSDDFLLEDPVNLLYFRDIALRYRGDAPSYAQILSTLTSNPAKLTEFIGHQVHANSDVAHRKYVWANRAAVSLAVDLGALGTTAALVAHH